MRIIAVILVAAALCAVPASADIVALKDGTVLECRLIDKRTEDVHGVTRAVWEVETSPGARRTLLEEQVAWTHRARVSWESGAEARKWYAVRKNHVVPKWQDQFAFAKECRRKNLYSETYRHFEKAYKLRKPEIPDTVEGHEQLAEWLLNECELYAEAEEEFRIVYKARSGKVSSAAGHMKLGRWCEKRLLYDEAEAEYRAALKRKPELAEAKKALKDLQKLRLASFHPKFHKELRGPFLDAIEWLKGKQNSDGSFGRDINVAGVQGHRGMTALCGTALIHAWELSQIERSDRPPNVKKLRGPDVWGNVWGIDFLVRCHRIRGFREFRGRIKEKLDEIYATLKQIQNVDGGWGYYDFAKNSSTVFVTAAMLVAFEFALSEKVGPDDALLESAVNLLKRSKLSEANYTYRRGQRIPLEGNTYRSPLCVLALLLAGQATQDELRLACDNFFKYRHIVKKIKGKRGTHIGQGKTAPYYYLFGH
ncbi:MAG: prenyltransferase/squalene oxidase repeat-containing protein, partial [Planctomycetota bacterium]